MGLSPQQNIVRTNGSPGVLLTVTRNGKASTLAIVNAVKNALPKVMATMPPELKLSVFGDQSLFVRSAIGGVVRETLIAAFLTGTVILLFLGSWRSTLIVCISIPLSILTSICILSLLGQTINVMTLGGLALAVGILVDDATVEIENTHRNLGMGKPLVRAVLDGASQIAVPTLVSTLSICIVFVPVLLLTGTARYLFTPLAMAVVFAMLASYLLSRTLVPTMVHHLLRTEAAVYQAGGHGGQGILWSVHRGANSLFERLRYRYIGLLDFSLRHRAPVLLGFSDGVFRFPAGWRAWWAVTSSPKWTPGRCGFTRAPPRARESNRPNFASPTWSRRSAMRCPPGRSTPSSITSEFRTLGAASRRATCRTSPPPTERF